jgi:hypothetical protein
MTVELKVVLRQPATQGTLSCARRLTHGNLGNEPGLLIKGNKIIKVYAMFLLVLQVWKSQF